MASVLDALVEMLGALAEHPEGLIGGIRVEDAGRLAGLLSSPGSSTDGARAAFRQPAGSTQEALASMWADLLGVDAVGIDDDFFAMGGTSLGAVRLFARIQDEFDVSLPLSTLITRPTIASLSEALESEGGGGDGPGCLVPIQPEGNRIPIICVHGGGGEILYYRPLADRLGPDQPVYGLEPVGLDGATEPLDTVPEMAARYVSELRGVQPHGPYRLVGYCFGGSVALEMAAQLEEAGEEVQMVGVIDGGLPLDAARASTTLARARALLRTRGVVGTGKAVMARVRNRGQILWDGSFGGIEGRERAKYSGVAQACSRAFSTFEPRPTRAPVTLIRSTESRVAEGKDWHVRWDEYTTEFHLEWIDAPHLDLFKAPAVEDLAETIRRMMGDPP
jgi:thioesterase domain-containing protein/acyl carrier protein